MLDYGSLYTRASYLFLQSTCRQTEHLIFYFERIFPLVKYFDIVDTVHIAQERTGGVAGTCTQIERNCSYGNAEELDKNS